MAATEIVSDELGGPSRRGEMGPRGPGPLGSRQRLGEHLLQADPEASRIGWEVRGHPVVLAHDTVE